jgi:hypothetical protein
MNSPYGQNLELANSLQDIGQALVGHAKQSVPVKLGLVDELFPYILIASKNMSARAISHWLEEKKNLKLSATSVAKAIREQDRFFERIYQRVLPGAEYLEDISEFKANEILQSKRTSGAQKTLSDEYVAKLNGSDEEQARSKELIIGIKMLNEWNGLPEEIRELCIEKCITNKKGKKK